MRSSKEALAVLNTLSSPACGLAHERIITNAEGNRVDAPVCAAHVRSTRISCAHCLDKKTKVDARKTFLRVLEFLWKRQALSAHEYEEMTAIVRDAGAALNRTDVDKTTAIHNREEVLLDWEVSQQAITAIEEEIHSLSETQRSIAGGLQEVLDLARERCAGLVQKP